MSAEILTYGEAVERLLAEAKNAARLLRANNETDAHCLDEAVAAVEAMASRFPTICDSAQWTDAEIDQMMAAKPGPLVFNRIPKE